MRTCQLSRLRLVPTAQAMKALATRGRNATDWSESHSAKVFMPNSFRLLGSDTEVSALQCMNAPVPMLVREWGSVREVIAVQLANA